MFGLSNDKSRDKSGSRMSAEQSPVHRVLYNEHHITALFTELGSQECTSQTAKMHMALPHKDALSKIFSGDHLYQEGFPADCGVYPGDTTNRFTDDW